MDQLQRRRAIQDIARKHVNPDGSFDMAGYQQELMAVDPESAMEMQQNAMRQKLLEFQTKGAERQANTAPTRQIQSGTNVLTQEQGPDGQWTTIATAPRFAPQESMSSALAQKIALLKKYGATDDDIKASLGISTGLPAANGATGPDYLKQLPANQRSVVQAVLDGRYPVPTGRAATSPEWQAVVQAATQVDPTFDAASYPARAAARKNLTSGKGANEIRSLNTLAGHLATLQQSIDALDNSNFSLYNRAANLKANEFGGDRSKALAQFNTAAKAVGDEAAKVFAGGQSALGDRQEIAHSLDPNAPADKLKQTLATYAELVQSRLEAVQQQADDSLGYGAQSIKVVTPKAKHVFDTLSGRSGPNTLRQKIDLNSHDPLELGL